MIVVDTNTIAYFWINGTFSKSAENLFMKDPDWIAPFLWKSEFRNVLISYVRKNLISLEQANKLMLQTEEQFKNKEYLITSDLVLELAAGSNCSAYDCEFVALAKEFKIKLVTSDKKILLNFPNISVSLDSYS